MSRFTVAPWNIQNHANHGPSDRLVVCAPDHNNRVCVLSINGAPHGDESVANDSAGVTANTPAEI